MDHPTKQEKTDEEEFVELVTKKPDDETITAEVQRIWAAGGSEAITRIKNYLYSVYGDDAEIKLTSDFDNGKHLLTISHGER